MKPRIVIALACLCMPVASNAQSYFVRTPLAIPKSSPSDTPPKSPDAKSACGALVANQTVANADPSFRVGPVPAATPQAALTVCEANASARVCYYDASGKNVYIFVRGNESAISGGSALTMASNCASR